MPFQDTPAKIYALFHKGVNCRLGEELSLLTEMKIPNLFRSNIRSDIREECLESDEFKNDLVFQNARRGKLLAIAVIGIEIVYVLADLISCFLKVSKVFSFYSYLAMYLAMIAISLAFLFSVDRFRQEKIHTDAMQACILFYSVFIMVWGGVISLMDQRLYGQLMSFMVNMMVCSIIFLADARRMSVPYLVSTLTLTIGLPFFQSSRNVLIGHYVNLLVFIVISWVASRIVYRNHCDSYIIHKLLQNEMRENDVINRKLAIANTQLRKLASKDELTGIANRRGFHEFIDAAFQNNADSDRTISILMIDIDYFKQYNDANGHEKGDLALVEVARQIDSMVEEPGQIAVRWGGEEFVYAAFRKTREDMLKAADTLRLKIRDLRIPNPSPQTGGYLTISLGACTGPAASTETVNRVIGIADRALYQAKENGRNRVGALGYEECPA